MSNLPETVAGVALGIASFIVAYGYDKRHVYAWLRGRTERIWRRWQHLQAELARFDFGAIVNIALAMFFLFMVWAEFFKGVTP